MMPILADSPALRRAVIIIRTDYTEKGILMKSIRQNWNWAAGYGCAGQLGARIAPTLRLPISGRAPQQQVNAVPAARPRLHRPLMRGCRACESRLSIFDSKLFTKPISECICYAAM